MSIWAPIADVVQVILKLGQLTSMPVKSIDLTKELRSLVMALNQHSGDKARYRLSGLLKSHPTISYLVKGLFCWYCSALSIDGPQGRTQQMLVELRWCFPGRMPTADPCCRRVHSVHAKACSLGQMKLAGQWIDFGQVYFLMGLPDEVQLQTLPWCGWLAC